MRYPAGGLWRLLVETGKSRKDLRDPSNYLRGLERDPNFPQRRQFSSILITKAEYRPASRTGSLAGRIGICLGRSSASGNREWSITDARIPTGGRSTEVLLDGGGLSLNLEHDICGEKESLS